MAEPAGGIVLSFEEFLNQAELRWQLGSRILAGAVLSAAVGAMALFIALGVLFGRPPYYSAYLVQEYKRIAGERVVTEEEALAWARKAVERTLTFAAPHTQAHFIQAAALFRWEAFRDLVSELQLSFRPLFEPGSNWIMAFHVEEMRAVARAHNRWRFTGRGRVHLWYAGVRYDDQYELELDVQAVSRSLAVDRLLIERLVARRVRAR